jgi:hypothetical protein
MYLPAPGPDHVFAIVTDALLKASELGPQVAHSSDDAASLDSRAATRDFPAVVRNSTAAMRDRVAAGETGTQSMQRGILAAGGTHEP